MQKIISLSWRSNGKHYYFCWNVETTWASSGVEQLGPSNFVYFIMQFNKKYFHKDIICKELSCKPTKPYEKKKTCHIWLCLMVIQKCITNQRPTKQNIFFWEMLQLVFVIFKFQCHLEKLYCVVLLFCLNFRFRFVF